MVLLVAGCVVLCLVGRKRNQPREDLWAAEELAFAAAQEQAAREQAALAASVPPVSPSYPTAAPQPLPPSYGQATAVFDHAQEYQSKVQDPSYAQQAKREQVEEP